MSDERLQKQGGMIVWDIDDPGLATPDQWQERFPNAELLDPLECQTRALTGDVVARVGVLLVHPNRPHLANRTEQDRFR